MSSTAPNVAAPSPVLGVRALQLSLMAVFLATVGVWLFSRTLLAANFLPHWYCYLGNRRLLWTNVIGDLLIGLSYVVISATLAWIVRRAGHDLPYSGFFWAFGLFIVSCGATHFMEVLTVWKPVYWLAAAVKLVTAAASAGTAIVLVVAAHDIVDFVRTAREAASRLGNERYRALVDAAPMAVVSATPDLNVTAWNPAAERTFGWTAVEAIGKKVAFVPPDKEEEHKYLLQKTMGGQVTTGFETTRINSAGTRFPVSISIAPVYDENRGLAGVLAVFEDISERKRIEQELQEKTSEQKRLETQMRQAQKMEVLGRLAGGVAHDFNNMLMVLGGSAELLDRAIPAGSAARMYVDQIQRTTEKAAAITKQLLAFSRKQVLEFRPMDLHNALTECEFMLPRLLGSDVVLTFDHQAAQSWILSDPSQIEQVVANLAINSRDAMPGGGSLRISTRNALHLPNESDSGDTAADGDPQVWVVLEVADSGCGMDEKTRAHIFEPFFTTKPEGKGTGLGLSTVYGIVKQSRGHIHVESTPGAGTRFQVFFPVSEAPPAAPPAAKPIELPDESGQGITILVADDQAALRHAVVEILRASGYTIIESESSTAALELAFAHKDTIDVLLTDVVMPGLRGPELARRVTQIHPETQVVYMSGYAEGFSEAELPANAVFIQKPFRFATLLEQLKLMRRKV